MELEIEAKNTTHLKSPPPLVTEMRDSTHVRRTGTCGDQTAAAELSELWPK